MTRVNQIKYVPRHFNINDGFVGNKNLHLLFGYRTSESMIFLRKCDILFETNKKKSISLSVRNKMVIMSIESTRLCIIDMKKPTLNMPLLCSTRCTVRFILNVTSSSHFWSSKMPFSKKCCHIYLHHPSYTHSSLQPFRRQQPKNT